MSSENFDRNQMYEVYTDEYSRLVEVFGTDTYIAQAVPGTVVTDALWRVQKIDTNGTKTWADGGAFSQVVSGDLSGLTFSY